MEDDDVQNVFHNMEWVYENSSTFPLIPLKKSFNFIKSSSILLVG
jgi:hypothetical protein